MDQGGIKKEIGELSSGIFSGKGFELVEIDVRNSGSGVSFTLLADRPQGGISLDECGMLNRLLKSALDEKGFLGGQYTLEVSSPGLDRPLKQKEDFRRCLGRQAAFFLNCPVNEKIEWRGLIGKVDEQSVFIDAGGGLLEIPLVKINKAKLVF
jgi:ribosome maturation factor RimP